MELRCSEHSGVTHVEEMLERKDVVGVEASEGGAGREEKPSPGGHWPVLVPHVADLLQGSSTLRQPCPELC